MYVIAAYATSPLPSMVGGAANIINSITALVSVPIISHGLNLPHLVLVFATMIPMIGSLNASNILAAMSMIPMAIAFTPRTSWK